MNNIIKHLCVQRLKIFEIYFILAGIRGKFKEYISFKTHKVFTMTSKINRGKKKLVLIC